MRAIIIAMLVVQAAMFLVTIYYMLTKRTASGGVRSVWSSLAIAMVLVGATSWQIGDRHLGEPGADVLVFGAPFMIGMAIMALLGQLRHRRGLDAAP